MYTIIINVDVKMLTARLGFEPKTKALGKL